MVAPYTGAWIEICVEIAPSSLSSVAPYTGAWIEITFGPPIVIGCDSRSLHGSVD